MPSWSDSCHVEVAQNGPCNPKTQLLLISIVLQGPLHTNEDFFPRHGHALLHSLLSDSNLQSLKDRLLLPKHKAEFSSYLVMINATALCAACKGIFVSEHQPPPDTLLNRH